MRFQKDERDGRRDGKERAALPSRIAGTPAQRWPVGTEPTTPEPGATSARLPMRAPGNSVLRAPTVAPAPIRMRPRTSRSPSSHQPDRSTSGSTAAPRPTFSMPVTGGSECRSTPGPIFAPRARA